MPIRVQSLRTSVKGSRPAPNTREVGELYVNLADLQLGVVDAGKNPQDIVAVRFFSSASDYTAGNFTIQAGALYRAKGAVTAGSFNPSQWDIIITAADMPSKENAIVPGVTTQYWRGDKTWATLDKAAVGLSNVDNTSDANKPVSTAQAAADATKVAKSGDTMSGYLGIPTGGGDSNPTRKDYVDAADAAIVAGITPASILSKLLTVDGTGSNLDADLLDGQSSAYYLTLSNQTGSINAAQHGNLAGGSLHAVATAATAGFIVDAASDSKQYVRKNAAWQEVVVPPNTVIADGPPASPANGQLWFESDTGNTYIWYDDGNSQQWVQQNVVASQVATYTFIGDTPPASPQHGNGWWQSSTGKLFLYYDDGNTKQWVQISGPQKVTGWEVIASGFVSNVASVDIPNLAPFRILRGSGQALNNSTSGNHLQIRNSTDNGATFDASGSNYGIQQASTSGTTASGAGGNYSAFVFAGQPGIAPSWNVGFKFQISEFNQNGNAHFLSQAVYAQPGPALTSAYSVAYHATSVARNAIRLMMATGNIAQMYYVLEGLRG